MRRETNRDAGPVSAAYGVLLCGVFAVSTASILVRYAQAEGLASLAIAAGRMMIAVLVLAPFAATSSGRAWCSLDAHGRRLIVVGGACLAIHFATWISSLAYTSVASSAALVTLHPLWVAIAAFLLFGERPGRLGIAGVLLALAGALLIVWSDETAGIGTAPLLGNALALTGGFTMAGYMLVGRAIRHRIETLPYVWSVYFVAALLLTGAASTGAASIVLSPAGIGWVVALALLPQLVGHTALNWSLRHVSATVVAVAIVGEPVASALLAWLLFAEAFAPLQMLGFALTLAGIVACAADEASQRRTAERAAAQ